MLLAIDIGNTNISAGIFSAGLLKKRFELATKNYSKSLLAKKLKAAGRISDSVICSVVPGLTPAVRSDLKKVTGKTPYIIGKGLVVPIRNRYRIPGQVGQDRLVNAYAASRLYSGPLIVIDSGTAVTFDVISGQREYLGGLIFPGLRMCLEALHEKTALLPQVKLTKPKALIGEDTKNSIISGVVLGTAALTKELAGRLKQRLGKGASVIGTGGNIDLIKDYAKLKMEIVPELTLIGIELIYEYYKNRTEAVLKNT